MPAPGPLKRDLVAGLEKGLAVIEAFDQERPRLTISEVAVRTGLTRAAARRYLLTLTHLGFVSQDRKMFALTPRVLRLGQSYMHSARLPRIVEPELHKLAFALKEASAAGVLDGGDVICIAATSAGRTVSPSLQPGARVAAHCSGNGRVLLAALPPEQADAWIQSQALQACTPHTITDPQRLRQEVARARSLGYACIDQELELGLRTLAVPLHNYKGEVVAAMNISTHASRLSMEQLVAQCLPPLLQAQAHLRMLL
ncbi:IclR family transcriptional regulator domain-containing protein [Roseateles koreensis]|uniref:IclR family transcriptional regulator C-terminal domain-containing protein n=1 Tax=Roseateles koreensis TaxID=2987526 RepID=A0ABT5KP48_9BURK|nr:IclR family transcriptional regulator C-terminal domain-containing protein [Roseateles koreensis]MDC8784694.1 IclR family transcriptional regulator C-terminal domain-containing protein [Roseateles koreensis]